MKLLILLLYSNLLSNSLFGPGESLKSFFWMKYNDTDTTLSGCYGYVKAISILDTDSSTLYFSRFGLPTYAWWYDIFHKVHFNCIITVRKNKPAEITRSSNHFSNIPWFESFERKDSLDIFKFYFPLLPLNTLYGRYDYFTVDVDSVLDLEFYGAGDSIMAGTFVNKKPTNSGTIDIKARNAIIVELTNSNFTRIKRISFDSTHASFISTYMGYNFAKIANNSASYGIQIIDNSPFPVIIPRLLTKK